MACIEAVWRARHLPRNDHRLGVRSPHQGSDDEDCAREQTDPMSGSQRTRSSDTEEAGGLKDWHELNGRGERATYPRNDRRVGGALVAPRFA